MMCLTHEKQKKMNCTEFKIWLESAPEEELINSPASVIGHTSECKACSEELKIIQSALKVLEEQKHSSLEPSQSANIINELCKKKETGPQNNTFMISRIAVAAIIILGILTGFLTGELLKSDSSNEENIWSSEFPVLSDNTDYKLSLFD